MQMPNSDHFFKGPLEDVVLVRAGILTQQELGLLDLLRRLVNQSTGLWKGTINDLARECRRDPKTIRGYVEALKEGGFIKVLKRSHDDKPSILVDAYQVIFGDHKNEWTSIAETVKTGKLSYVSGRKSWQERIAPEALQNLLRRAGNRGQICEISEEETWEFEGSDSSDDGNNSSDGKEILPFDKESFPCEEEQFLSDEEKFPDEGEFSDSLYKVLKSTEERVKEKLPEGGRERTPPTRYQAQRAKGNSSSKGKNKGPGPGVMSVQPIPPAHPVCNTAPNKSIPVPEPKTQTNEAQTYEIEEVDGVEVLKDPTGKMSIYARYHAIRPK
jgi:hypothetical protein